MIKVRVLRGMQVGLPLASSIATGVFAFSGLACSAPVDEESVDSSESSINVSDPGTGVLELGWAYGTPTGYTFNAKNSTDEYVRALEKMSFNIPAHFLWSQLHPSEPVPALDRLKEISAKVTITYYKNGGSYGSTSVTTNKWDGDVSHAMRATTNEFVVSRRAQAMRFSLEITDHGVSGPPYVKTLDQSSFFEVPVIGGTLPQKTALFDHQGSDLRTRILEGGSPVQGGDLAVVYTDWRAAMVVDQSSIDRQIGNSQSFGRFGAIEIPIYGELEYEITYGAAIDGVWHGEEQLTSNSKSRFMPPTGRTAYEGNLSVPNGAQSIQMYFHVKTFLKVDYSRHPNVRWRKYNDGERILVRERWDNENGATNDNYDFSTETK